MEELKGLVISARFGDMEAFGRIIRQFQDMAYGYAYSILGDFHLAEDATQEAFIEVYLQLRNLHAPEAFPGWLRRIVFKHCDRIIRCKHPQTVPLDEADRIATYDAGPDQIVEQYEMEEKVLEATHSVSEHQRIVTMLFYINGYSQREIAEFLEIPITTVQKRLYSARRQLKERMMTMVEIVLKDKILPDDFAQNLLMFPFPRHEPPVSITECPGERLNVHCVDAQAYFVPLIEGGKCDWTFYDWPNPHLTGVYECYVIDSARSENISILRGWTRFTDFKENGRQDWSESFYLNEGDTWRWIQLGRDESGKVLLSEHPRPGALQDPMFEPVPMKLKVGSKWDGFAGGEVVGVSVVTIGRHSWKCLKAATVAQHFKNPDGAPAVYAEWYVAETGRTIFFRRYNGPGYAKPGSSGNFESLAGNFEVEFHGIRFRHWYDCIPDIALAEQFI